MSHLIPVLSPEGTGEPTCLQPRPWSWYLSEDDILLSVPILPPYDLHYSWEPITEFTNRSTYPDPDLDTYQTGPQNLVVYGSRGACEEARRDIAQYREMELRAIEESYSLLKPTVVNSPEQTDFNIPQTALKYQDQFSNTTQPKIGSFSLGPTTTTDSQDQNPAEASERETISEWSKWGCCECEWTYPRSTEECTYCVHRPCDNCVLKYLGTS